METIVPKKHWTVAIRINHWAMALTIFVLIGTGFLIAYPVTVQGGETWQKFSVGEMRFWHNLFGVILILLFVWRVYLAFFSTFRADWKDLFDFTDISNTIREIKFYLLIEKKAPPETGLYGPVQAMVYLALWIMVFGRIITGLILMGAGYDAGITGWAYVLLKPVERLMGGLATVRYLHHVFTWFFVLFIVVHVYMAFWYDAILKQGTISSMISGYRFERVKE